MGETKKCTELCYVTPVTKSNKPRNRHAMTRHNKIEQFELGQYVLDLYTQYGLSSLKINKKLLDEKKISISYRTISEYLSDEKDHAHQVSQTVREEHVRKNLSGHLNKLDNIIDDLYDSYFETI